MNLIIILIGINFGFFIVGFIVDNINIVDHFCLSIGILTGYLFRK